MGMTVSYRRPDGKECSAYYAAPAAQGAAPGIVVIQEWWGLNEQIKGVAERLAQAGYRALVPDLFRGKVTLDVAEAEHLMAGLDFLDAATQDVSGAVQFLKGDGAKVGVMGFCMGGAVAMLAAVHVPQADAVVSWYGVPPDEAGDTRTIKAPLQGHFALNDQFFPPERVDALEALLKEGGVPYEFHHYAAGHAFANETGPNHDPQAAQLAWQRTMDFLRRRLA